MPTHKTIPLNHGIFSITFTCVRWLPLIEAVQGYDLVYKWFDLLKTNGHAIVGYVIMPNHLHTLICFRKSEKSINSIIGNGKRFMAYDIIDRLEQEEKIALLHEIKMLVQPPYLLRNKKHQVWEYSFDWKQCISESFILQKLNYYHKNPCTGKWMLASAPENYPHSSAAFYYTGKQGIYQVTHYNSLADMEWS